MAGAVALVGSGEYLEVMQPLESRLIDLAVAAGRNPRYIQLATAAGAESDESFHYWRDLGARAAARIGVEVVFVPIRNREDANRPAFAEMISDSGLIYLSGGSPQHLAKSLFGTLAGAQIQQSWLAGASIAGCSAGAMALARTVPNALQFRRSETAGLAIAGDLHVLPHYDKYFGWAGDQVMKFVSQFSGSEVVVGVDEQTAIVQTAGEWEVFGEGEVHLLSESPIRRLRAGARFS